MNRDGFDDYLLSVAPDPTPPTVPGSVEVRNGRDDTILWTAVGQGGWATDFGRYALGAIDLDGDTHPDVLVEAPNEGSGTLYAFDNRGSVLYRIPVRVLGRLGNAGDIDGDRCEDFTAPDIVAGGGATQLRSGRTGSLIAQGMTGPPGAAYLSVASTGCRADIDGDGVQDFCGGGGTFMSPGFTAVYSGATGNPIYEWVRPVSTFGQFLQAADLDGDGFPELLSGSSEPFGVSGGRIHWYDLRKGTAVTEIYPAGLPPERSGFGDRFRISPAIPGSPFRLLGTGEPTYLRSSTTFNYYGRTVLYELSAPTVQTHGQACAGSLASQPSLGLRPTGFPQNNGVLLRLAQAPPNAPVLFALGLSNTTWSGAPLPIPLSRFAFTGCSLHTAIDVFWQTTAGTAWPNAGYAELALNLPLNPNANGIRVYGQALVLDPTGNPGGAITEGLSWQF